LDVAAEVESLEKDCPHLTGTQWMLDPGMVPAGLFQFGLSPYSDLVVLRGGQDRIVVEALLAPGADHRALSRCRARLVLPAVRRILAEAGFTVVGSKARAELRLPFRPDELAESWIEVVQDKRRPVRSATGHRTRRALRWADAALRAERAPAALDQAATRADWSALAAAAWDRCRIDWAAAGDTDRAYLAARRQAVVDPRACVPPVPSATAAEIARRFPLAGPACLAEAVGPWNRYPSADGETLAGFSITTSTRRFAAEAPDPTASLAPCPTMTSADSGTPCASSHRATAVARSNDST